MQLRCFFLTILLFLLSEDFGFAQQSTERKWTLPEGTIEHLGEESINDIAYSPDGGLLAVASGSDIWLYDTVTHQEVARLIGHPGEVSVAFSPNGLILATGSWKIGSFERTVRLWDVASGTLLRTPHTYPSQGVNSVAFSPNGLILATGGWDQTVRLYNVTTGELRQPLEGHTFDVKHVAFSPDGKVLASAGDQTVRLWSVITGRHLRTLHGHTGFVNSVSFSPKGKTLASAGSDRKILLWSVGWAPADVNRDDKVNIQDLVLVAGAIGHIGENEADVNGDGIVDIRDLVLVAGAFGED